MKNVIKTVALAAIASLALTGCIKHEPYGHRPGPDGGESGGHGGGTIIVEPQAIDRPDWIIEYQGRRSEKEWFKFTYVGSQRFIFRTVTDLDFKSLFKSDMVDYIDNAVYYLNENALVFTSSVEEYFDRLRSGVWHGFMIELDKDGKATYNYSEIVFTIQEEQASKEYTDWLGNWRVMSGTVGFDIRISHLDNNFLYKINGWECGDAVNFKMNWLEPVFEQYLEGEFWEPDKCLYIRSQYLGTYTDNDFGYGEVDEVFLGNIFDSNGLSIITDEGIDVARMVMKEKDVAELRAEFVTLETGDGSYETQFHSMQYYMWDHKNQEYHPYNANAGNFKLPFSMTRLPDDYGTRAAGLAMEQERVTTKKAVFLNQPRVSQGDRNSVAKKAVRMK